MNPLTTPYHPIKPDIHPMIENSALLLDEVLESPEWDRLIDIENFDIDSSSACVLGQTGDGHIPGDGWVPWSSYASGQEFLDEWAHNHPHVAERLGLNIEWVGAAFALEINDLSQFDQDEQWKQLLQYRRDMRDFETEEAVQSTAS